MIPPLAGFRRPPIERRLKAKRPRHRRGQPLASQQVGG